eukprot:CAMPEP_0172839652 /NCGR_PEP_ID=MMETSP1075-20121228/28716_1 /TAXON_ID=2916 /ORGANISM="Ceratium fusus, Strain PA161109" /LENGTH=374 /DNA_ID=CAMNT_0013683333 /DNA_START=37 /DNA_END=1158 /DNA_ORIENTATION=-
MRAKGDADMLSERDMTVMLSKTPSAPALMSTLESILDGPVFNYYHAGTIFNKLAKLQDSISERERHHAQLKALIKRVDRMLLVGGVNCRSTCNIFWSVAKLRSKLPEAQQLVPSLVEALKLHSALDFDSQGLANSLWSCATLRLPRNQTGELLPLLAEGVFMHMDAMKAQELANIFWATAVMKHDAPELLDLMPTLQEGLPCLHEKMNPQEVANVIWALGQTRLQVAVDFQSLKLLIASAAKFLDRFNGQELANLCWGLALCNFQDCDFMRKVASETARRSPSWSNKAAKLDLPQIACSFAKAKIHHPAMLVAIAKRILPNLKILTDWGLCAMLWSYDVLDTDGRFCDFRDQIHIEVSKRSLSASDVTSSQHGP